jgi:hypothetical protein
MALAVMSKIRDDTEGWPTVGYKFSLVLSREVTDEESALLEQSGCAGAIFMTDSLPTNADVTVTKIDFDDTASPSLAEAIESALEAVKKVPDLGVPGLTVPAQPAHAPAEKAAAEDASPEELEATAGEKPDTRKATVRKAAAAEHVETAATSG